MTFINQQTSEVQSFIQIITHTAIEVGRECEKLQFDRSRTADIVNAVLDVNDRMFNQIINGDIKPIIKASLEKAKELAGSMVGKFIEDDNIIYATIKTTSEQKVQIIDILHDVYREFDTQLDSHHEFMNIIGNVIAGYVPLKWKLNNNIDLKDEFTHIIPNYLVALDKYRNL